MPRLLETKLQAPPLREERVYRPDLYENLADVTTGVLLVSAPAGFGKSTLIVEWLTAQERPFAWYSLDRYDGEMALFGEYLGRVVEALTGRPSTSLSLPGEGSPDTRTMIATLLDDLVEAPQGSALVLDDYHEIEDQEVHEGVGYLAENLPNGLMLVIATRADPPLPLSRLRSRGQLHEIRGSDLRFRESDVAEYFRSRPGTSLSDSQVRSITERTEGWVSALQLAGLGIEAKDHPAMLGSLSAQHPHIAAYLVDEVLERLRPDLSDFLLATSPFERFDAQLCRDTSGTSDAASKIDELDRQNAFLIPLDSNREWYRYHHLFAELLRSRLRRSDPARFTSLLLTAARACEERGLTDDALDYALKAGDLELATKIVDKHMLVALGGGEIARLRSWLRLFPVTSGPSDHILSLGWAWCRLFSGETSDSLELVDRVEAEHSQDFARDTRGQLEIIRAIAAFQGGDPSTAESHAQEGLRSLPKPSPYLEALGHLYVGRSLHAQGRREEARPHLQRAAGLAERGNTLAAVMAHFWLGVVEMDLGNLVDAERAMIRARDAGARSMGSSDNRHPATGIGDVGLAYIRLNQLEADEAIQLAESGALLLKRSGFVEMVFRAFFVWAEALSIAGQFDTASRVIDEGIEWLHGRRIGGGPLETWLLMARARNSWREGRFDDAKILLGHVRERGLGSPNRDEALGFYEAADEVSYELRRGNLDKGALLLEGLPLDPTGNVMFAIKRHVLTAALHEARGERRLAVETLEEAVELAHQGYRYQFSFVGPLVRPTLGRMVRRTKHDGFVRSIIENLPAEIDEPSGQPVDPLTERELDVLAEIAAGYSNEEIAERLFISRGTVKRHASNIYLKLGAHHRAEAAARGRDLGLID